MEIEDVHNTAFAMPLHSPSYPMGPYRVGRIQGRRTTLAVLERRGYLQAGPYVPEVVLDFPEQVENLHRDFLRAGSDVIEAFTYYAHREKLRLIDRERDLVAGRQPRPSAPASDRASSTPKCWNRGRVCKS